MGALDHKPLMRPAGRVLIGWSTRGGELVGEETKKNRRGRRVSLNVKEKAILIPQRGKKKKVHAMTRLGR